MTRDSNIRVLLVDDHPAVRDGLTLLLASDGIVVSAGAGGRTEALSCLKEPRPDLAIVDLSLEGEDGLALIADLHQRNVRVLVYSMHSDARHVSSTLAAGALGYVTKREFHTVLVQGVREVAAGRRFLSPNAGAALAQQIAEPPPPDGVGRLSSQECEVYKHLGQGKNVAEIALAMDISAHTVESYFKRIVTKLKLSGMHELRRHSIEHFQKQA